MLGEAVHLAVEDLSAELLEAEQRARILDLLKARSGVFHPAAYAGRTDSRPRGSEGPGRYFAYNNWDFNVLGTLFIQFTGRDIFQALYDDFATPLQMQEFQPANGAYYYEEMSEHPAYHFSMSPRDMARFGLLILRDGRWRDQQLVPSSWMDRMLTPYSDAGST